MKFLKSLKALIEGHFTVFKHSFKRRVTLEYPEKKPDLPERFRGKPKWDGSKCIACKVCMRVCPADAVKIEQQDDNIKYDLDLTKCIFCGNCMYYCPKKAIELSKEYELAVDDKSLLNIECNNEKGNL